MAKTKRDKKRFKDKNKQPQIFSYKLHFGVYFDSHPCTYKKMNRRIQRAKEKQALRESKEAPRYRKTYNYDYHMDW